MANVMAVAIARDVHLRSLLATEEPPRGGGLDGVRLPVTEHACEHVLTLPCFPELADKEVDLVCEALHEL